MHPRTYREVETKITIYKSKNHIDFEGFPEIVFTGKVLNKKEFIRLIEQLNLNDEIK